MIARVSNVAINARARSVSTMFNTIYHELIEQRFESFDRQDWEAYDRAGEELLRLLIEREDE